MIPPDSHSGRRRPPPAPNTQLGLWPGAGRERPGVGTQTLVPLNFSAVVATLITTPSTRIKSDTLYDPLLFYSVFTVDTSYYYAVTLIFDPVTLTFDLEHL